uniref:ATP synthase complex subunit 8 n=1 Tax=Pentanemus quinquarius TaxID=206147 RepID=A0A898CYB2_9TELE|nr:ATP synthase F0 subunit 8 [Pentanemus quinquarius]QSH90830.1 ATP synthase F0 subunit 8 [Pentanemus quinquarius]
MPQLNPAPWLSILLISWLVLLALVFPKILNYTFPNSPALQNTQKAKKEPWFWPWH